jgi:HNH endonuclease/NUMOD4 motif/Helix-turn-helix domain
MRPQSTALVVYPPAALLGERWRPVPGWPYEVSDHGSLRRTADASYQRNYRAGRLLKPSPDRLGYLRITLQRDRMRRGFTVHGLVAVAFLGPRPAGYEVDHRDGNRRNNWASNLDYVTHSENIKRAVRRGTVVAPVHRKLTYADVDRARRWLSEGVSQSEVGRRLGVGHKTISNLARGLTWRHHGEPQLTVPEGYHSS